MERALGGVGYTIREMPARALFLALLPEWTFFGTIAANLGTGGEDALLQPRRLRYEVLRRF